MKNCNSCKYNKKCKYQNAFDIDENVGCISWLSKDTKDTYISPNLSDMSYVGATADVVSLEMHNEDIKNVENKNFKYTNKIWGIIRGDIKKKHKKLKQEIDHKEEQIIKLNCETRQDYNRKLNKANKLFKISLSLSIISLVLWLILIIIRLVVK